MSKDKEEAAEGVAADREAGGALDALETQPRPDRIDFQGDELDGPFAGMVLPHAPRLVEEVGIDDDERSLLLCGAATSSYGSSSDSPIGGPSPLTVGSIEVGSSPFAAHPLLLGEALHPDPRMQRKGIRAPDMPARKVLAQFLSGIASGAGIVETFAVEEEVPSHLWFILTGVTGTIDLAYALVANRLYAKIKAFNALPIDEQRANRQEANQLKDDIRTINAWYRKIFKLRTIVNGTLGTISLDFTLLLTLTKAAWGEDAVHSLNARIGLPIASVLLGIATNGLLAFLHARGKNIPPRVRRAGEVFVSSLNGFTALGGMLRVFVKLDKINEKTTFIVNGIMAIIGFMAGSTKAFDEPQSKLHQTLNYLVQLAEDIGMAGFAMNFIEIVGAVIHGNQSVGRTYFWLGVGVTSLGLLLHHGGNLLRSINTCRGVETGVNQEMRATVDFSGIDSEEEYEDDMPERGLLKPGDEGYESPRDPPGVETRDAASTLRRVGLFGQESAEDVAPSAEDTDGEQKEAEVAPPNKKSPGH